MSGIFISYRRDDTGGYVLALYDRLAAHFGEDFLFMDIRNIPHGVDFRRVINDTVGSCDVLIALIGREWLTITDSSGRRRLDDPRDFVRLEIAAALERGIPVIPVLVRGAQVPSEDDLPDVLKELAYRQGQELSDRRFDYDVGQLIEGIDHLVDRPADAPPLPRPDPEMARPEGRQPYEPETVLVRAGAVQLGSTDRQIRAIAHVEIQEWAWQTERHQRTVNLPDYGIGKYPVMVKEFRPFVEGDGYTNDRYWTRAGWALRSQQSWTEPRYWGEDLWTGNDELPVIGVSWFEAYAYCRWLEERTKKPYRLPLEAEWEKAARGTEGFLYPWGNTWNPDACNHVDRWGGVDNWQHGHTTPVKTFAHGASPCEAVDTVGNVWEWSAACWVEEYRYPEDDRAEGSIDRTIRGGAWSDVPEMLRAAARNWSRPDERNRTTGFRVCLPFNAGR